MKKIISIILCLSICFSLTAMLSFESSAVNIRTSSDGLWTYYEAYTGKYEDEIQIATGYYGKPAYHGHEEHVVIPETIDGHTVSIVGGSAFYGCDWIKSITIPKTVSYYGTDPFGNCTSLEAVYISDLEQFCYSYFEFDSYNPLCRAGHLYINGVEAKRIVLPAKEEAIRSNFNYCKSVEELVVQYPMKGIGDAFSYCENLKKVTLPDSITQLSYASFEGCSSLKEIRMPAQLKKIDRGAFAMCTSLEGIDIPQTVETIGDGAFAGCSSLRTIKLPQNLKSLGEQVFYKCPLLESIEIPDNITEIGTAAFNKCSSLKTVKLPKNLKTIGEAAFSECPALEVITIPASVESIADNAFTLYNGVSLKKIIGYKGSYAETFAREKGIKFEPIQLFPDVPGNAWFYDSVTYVGVKGFVTGYQNGKFGPGDNLKRQDFVVILARIAKADLTAYQGKASKLKDVDKNAYYAAAVNWAVDNGIISGYQNGKFGVGDNITREQVATILYRYMGSPKVDNPDSILSKFSDAKKVSAFAKEAVAWAVQNSIISGMADGRVASTEGASRAQIAVIIMKMDQQGMFDKE
ncbi:MAG: leucine-rich repeat protein [Clostridia bacterium]|nr:leucine-rich repeat protein [Clostridia bacterium]